MARTKKITDKEFIKLVIDKELEISNADIRYDDIIALPKEEQEKLKWWTKYTFKKYEEFEEWKNFFEEHFYDWQPKSVNKKQLKQEFEWFNLMWGLKYDFNYEVIELMRNTTFRKAYDAYKKLIPSYDVNLCNHSFNKQALQIYGESFNRKFEKELETFINENSDKLTKFFSNIDITTPVIFKEPMILLYLYGIKKKEKETMQKWQFSNEELNILKNIL